MTEATQAPHQKNTYETVEGTEPGAYEEHVPRTIVRTVDDFDAGVQQLYMMTEIGDGVFVQWSTCRRCTKRVGVCKCPEGPQEPEYMRPWREKRFVRSLNERPNPEHALIDSVLTWARDRGYTVKKKGEKTPGEQLVDNSLFLELFKAAAECEAPEGTQLDDVLGEFQEAYDQIAGVKLERMAVEKTALTEDDLVDEDAIDFARETLGEQASDDEVQDLAEQRATRDLKEIDVDF